MGDMMILAFQTDVTRVSLMLANAGSNRSYRQIGVMSATTRCRITRTFARSWRKFQRSRRSTSSNSRHPSENEIDPEGDGSLLDTIILRRWHQRRNKYNKKCPSFWLDAVGVYSSRSSHPVPEDTPLNNLFVTSANQMVP